jgi:hypothetical protein
VSRQNRGRGGGGGPGAAGVRMGMAYQRRRLGLLRLGRRWRCERASGGENCRAGVHAHRTLHLAATHLRPPLSVALLPLPTVRHARHHAGHHARLHRHAGLHALPTVGHASLLLLHVLLRVHLLGVALRRLAVPWLLLLIALLLLAVMLIIALLALVRRSAAVHRRGC